MPPKQATSKLSKYKSAEKFARAHANDPVNLGFQPLPAGIKNGIAQLVELGFKEVETGDYKGELALRGKAVVVFPDTVATPEGVVPVKGKHTYLSVALYARKDVDQEKAISDVLNELKKLGADTSDFNDIEDLQTYVDAIMEASPYFNFSTSESKFDPTRIDPKTKQPYPVRVFENWNSTKGLEDYVPEPSSSAIDKTATKAAPSKNGSHKEKEEKADDIDLDGDLDSLLAKADEGDDAAISKLTEFAVQKGYTEEDVLGADSYAEVVEWIKGPGKDAGEDTKEVRTPGKGDTCDYAPPDPKDKTGKKRQKKAQCEVVSISKREETCTLKNLATKKTYEDVSWSELVWE